MTKKEKIDQKTDWLTPYVDGDYKTTREILEKIIKLNKDKDSSGAYYLLASILTNHLKEYEKAEKYYEKAIKLNPYNDIVYNDIANLYYKHLKNIKNAQKNFLLAIENNPNDDLTIENLESISNFKEQTFISEFEIKNVRHQKDIKIPLSEANRKHLFLTGKNGSGKTSVLKEAENYMQRIIEIPIKEIFTEKGKNEFLQDKGEYKLKFNVKQNLSELRVKYEAGNFTIVFFGDDRKLEKKLKPVTSIEKIDLKLKSLPKEDLSENLLKFLIWQDYKQKSNINDENIKRFFRKIHSKLKKIYKDD